MLESLLHRVQREILRTRILVEFVPLQRLLGRHDALNEYINHVSSALFAIPPGLARVGDWWGRELFG